MEIEVRELEPCKLKVNYYANAEEILNKRHEVLNAFKKAPVPGFRPGKASLDAINMHYRSQIEDSLKRALAEDAFHNTLFEKKLKAHGTPEFHTALFDSGKFFCEFQMYVRPEFELSESYKSLEIPKPHEQMSVADLSERILQDIRVKQGETTAYCEEDFVQTEDNIILDYEGTLDGVKHENISAIGEMLTVGHSQLVEFDNNLLGMKLHETREFDIKVPEGGTVFSGKTLHFKATLNMGSKNVPHALDDSLAQKLGAKDLNGLREMVSGTASMRLQEAVKQTINGAICNRLADDNRVDIPQWMATSEAQFLAQKSKIQWDQIKDEDREKLLTIAKRNCSVTLILDKIRDVEPEAQLSDQEVFEMVKKHLHGRVKDVDSSIKEMSKTGQLQVLFVKIRDEYTLDFIGKRARIVE